MKLYVGIALACLGAKTIHAERVHDDKPEYVPQLRRSKTSAKLGDDKSEYPILSRDDGIYNNELVKMASNINRLSMEETRRHLQTFDELWDMVSEDDDWSWDDDIWNTVKEDFDNNYQIVGDANFQQCSLDTSVLLLNNPNLQVALSDYILSASYTQDFDPGTFTIYTNIYYPEAEAENVRQLCAQAGGYFDVNVGALSCEYFCSVTSTYSFVNCLANTQECRAKGNYEHLQYALEGQGFSNCRAPERPAVTLPPRPATLPPRPATSPPRPVTTSPPSETSPPRPAPLPAVDPLPAPGGLTNLTMPNPPQTNLSSVTTSSLVNCSADMECVSALKFNFTGKACPPSSSTCTDFMNFTSAVYYYEITDAFDMNTVYITGFSMVGNPVSVPAIPIGAEANGTEPFCFDRLLHISISDVSDIAVPVVQTSLISSSCNFNTGIGKVFQTDDYGAFEFLGIEV